MFPGAMHPRGAQHNAIVVCLCLSVFFMHGVVYQNDVAIVRPSWQKKIPPSLAGLIFFGASCALGILVRESVHLRLVGVGRRIQEQLRAVDRVKAVVLTAEVAMDVQVAFGSQGCFDFFGAQHF